MAIINSFKSLISLSTLNTSIALATIALERVFNNVVFKCPCVTDSSAPLNPMYGIMFLVAPASVLLVLGFVLNPKTWKFFTGCCKRARNEGESCCTFFVFKFIDFCKRARTTEKCCFTFFVILFRALVAPLSWISIGFLDGKYYACAVTKRPYDQSCEVVNRGTGAIIYSEEYYTQIAVSRLIGWFTVAGCFILGALVYTVYRCCLNLDHWHYEKSKWTKTIREDVFQKLVKEEIKKKAKDDLQIYLNEEDPEAIFKFFD